MSWTADELNRMGDSEELELASARPDGSLRSFVPVWIARVGDDIFVRSQDGPENGWYRRALESGSGRIRAGGVERNATFVQDSTHSADVDAVYRAKYGHYDAETIVSLTSELAHGATLRIVPTD